MLYFADFFQSSVLQRLLEPFTDETQSALFKDPDRTAL
jgi:hypothetical protein